jgi:hypothetical protein
MPIASADTVYWRVLNAGPPVDIAPLTFSVRDLSAIGYAKVSAVLSIPEMCDGCVASLSLPFVGAVAGDRVAPGWPSDLPSTLMGEMVAGAGEIVIKLLNAGIRIAGSNHTFSASITK